jgi:putative FmdB family regulatory protein
VPTYQYVCTECGGQLEAVQKFTDDPLTVHEDCGGRLRKVFSPVGIVFKGSGFYKTDSRSGSASSSSPASSKENGSKESGSKEGGAKESGTSSSESSSSSKSGSDSSSSTAGSSSASSGAKVA